MSLRKRIVLIITVLVLTALFAGMWNVYSSWRTRVREREERIRAAAERKFEEVKVTLIEGWTLDQIYDALAKAGFGSVDDFTKAAADLNPDDYIFLTGQPNKISLEGYLFPDTYRLAKNATQDAVLAVLLGNFQTRFGQASKNVAVANGLYVLPGFENLRINNRTAPGLTLHEIVTLASIVERETGRVGESANSDRLLEERKTVAGIFLNRLSINQALQSDATINYITRSGRASATLADLEIDSPYNTYKYPGLTPGPIGAPSLSSLAAVMEPIKTDYYYFLHSQTTGEVHYGRTLDEHNQNRSKYLR